ncbi:uncharacterized protein K452DRAFT_283652 [Aplosporella prunicola CBS 121167]|uniref:Uncharacterized protein n=1 Tax=Aplosporella prunicola CBS 121167 TaxID=1176127 RepID=A0A6A6BT13_9PEZI|nr:uncharacterized protein K452DRAFT_283652 [Aplosporella prunicola CBS 121167]KAF2146384.1 hypothetical protein K452DRAFT_283652 [Aplosporella prunicola CBS 121167]
MSDKIKARSRNQDQDQGNENEKTTRKPTLQPRHYGRIPHAPRSTPHARAHPTSQLASPNPSPNSQSIFTGPSARPSGWQGGGGSTSEPRERAIN